MTCFQKEHEIAHGFFVCLSRAFAGFMGTSFIDHPIPAHSLVLGEHFLDVAHRNGKNDAKPHFKKFRNIA
ncbi:MAG: hypothetical protein RRZ24_01560 [Clostridia bacterium]